MSSISGKFDDYELFNEDCIDTVKRIPDNFIDLIYLDPPFCSGKTYCRNQLHFYDSWNDPEKYIDWIEPKIKEFKRILKKTGTIYIHCDCHASHYLKVSADKIFNRKNFLNEIIWQRQSAHNDVKQGSRHFGRIHDTILVYTKSKDYVWNQQYLSYDPSYVKKTYKYSEVETKRKFALGDLTGPGGAHKKNPYYEFLGIKRYWRYKETKMYDLLEKGRISHKSGRVPLLKRYLDEMKGKPIQDVWTRIKSCSSNKKHYPTQKPENLLYRIIRTSSNPNQLVYDPFSGSSTSGVVSYKLSRRWIGSEISKKACMYSLKRFEENGCALKINTQVFPVYQKVSKPERQFCLEKDIECR